MRKTEKNHPFKRIFWEKSVSCVCRPKSIQILLRPDEGHFCGFSRMSFHAKYVCLWCLYLFCLNIYEFVALILWNVNNNYGLDVYVLYIMHASTVMYILTCCECVERLSLFLAMYVPMVIHPSILVKLFLDVVMNKSPSITAETWFWQSP